MLNITDGSLGDFFDAHRGSEVNISGGTLGDSFDAFLGSVVNISGGTVGDFFDANFGSEVNIFGSQFLLDDVELDSLLLGESIIITDRDVTLSGLLADGEQFSFDLNSSNSFDTDFFDSNARLVLTLTSAGPEPSSTAFITLAIAMGLARRRRS